MADYHTTSLAALSKFGFLFLEGSIRANFGSHIHSPDKVLALGALFSSWSCDTRLAAQKANFWQPQSTDLHLEKNIPNSLKRQRKKFTRAQHFLKRLGGGTCICGVSVALYFLKKGASRSQTSHTKKTKPTGSQGDISLKTCRDFFHEAATPS